MAAFVDIGAQSAGGSIVQQLAAVALPTHSEGDLLLIFAFSHGTTDAAVTATGYSILATIESGTGGSRLEVNVLGKFAGASESAPTVDWDAVPGGSVTAQIASFSDVDPAIEDAVAVTSENTSTENPFTPTGITTVTAGALVLSIVATNDDNALALSVDQGFTLQAGGADYDTALGSDGSFGLATKEITSPGAVTVPTWDQTVNGPDRWSAITMALKPLDSVVTGAAVGAGQLFGGGAGSQHTGVVHGQGVWPADLYGRASGSLVTGRVYGSATGYLATPWRASGGRVLTGKHAFIPPTYRQSFDPEPNRHGKYALMRWYSFEVGYSVLITDGVATTYPGKTVPTTAEILAADSGNGDGGRAMFSNGATYLVNEDEKTILEAAGYTVS